MTDLRLVRIMEECDESIHKITETLKDLRAGLISAAEAKKIKDRLSDRVTVLEQQLAEMDRRS